MESKFKLFTAARVLAGISVDEFAKRLGVSRQHVFVTLKDPNESARVSQAIDEFIEKNLPMNRQNPAKRMA